MRLPKSVWAKIEREKTEAVMSQLSNMSMKRWDRVADGARPAFRFFYLIHAPKDRSQRIMRKSPAASDGQSKPPGLIGILTRERGRTARSILHENKFKENKRRRLNSQPIKISSPKKLTSNVANACLCSFHD